MGNFIIFLSIILTLTSGVLAPKPSIKVEQINKGILGLFSGNQFSFREEIPKYEKEVKYTFVLVKHGMAVPEFTSTKSYPNDDNYKPRWEPGEPTMRGRCLMLMVGRSLKTRYREFLNSITSWDEIKISSITKEYAKRLTADLTFGLFSKTVHEKMVGIDLGWISTDDNFEKIEKLMPLSRAQCSWMKIILDKVETEIHLGLLGMTRCTENLYETLKNYVVVMDEKNLEWYMDSPERVYNLWTLLVFEVVQGQKEPEWAKNHWSRIQTCVFEYHRTLLDFHPAVPAMILGRMIKQMEEEVNSGTKKFHVHVTNDITALSMNWTLPSDSPPGRNYWPDPGDALMFDFFTDDTVLVSSFSGWQRRFDKIYEGSQAVFFQNYKNKNIYLSEKEWQSLCSYDGKSKPSKKMDEKLFASPTCLLDPNMKLNKPTRPNSVFKEGP